jgi:hypothetical protein
MFLGGCASNSLPPKSTEPLDLPATKAEKSKPDARQTAGLDLTSLRSHLGLKRNQQDLGYAEKAFDGCRLGYYGEDGKCGQRYLTVVNFRLVCRDSEDTVQTVVTETKPIVTDQVKWKLSDVNGVTKTDSSGYGTLQVVTNKTLRGQRLVLTVGQQFLGLRVGDVSQIVVPVYWCTQLANKTGVLSKTAAR